MRRLIAGSALVAVALAAGCSSSSTSPTNAVKSWAHTNGLGTSIAAIRTDARSSLHELTTNASPNAVHTVCAAMLQDVDLANGNLPTPDPTLSSLLAKGYSAIGAAANTCYGAINNPLQLARFNAERIDGLGLLAEAQARAEELIGTSLLPTGTTEPADTGQ